LISDRRSARGKACEHLLARAVASDCEIWTSSFCLAEVFKRKCDGELVGLAEEKDTYFEELIEQEFVRKVSVDVDVGKVARRLLRRFPSIGKPQDAIHVATCLLNNLDELHTFDRKDLIGLGGELERLDREKLVICEPPPPPEEEEPKLFGNDEADDNGVPSN
jgi:predicted nucleic acid-binding protein